MGEPTFNGIGTIVECEFDGEPFDGMVAALDDGDLYWVRFPADGDCGHLTHEEVVQLKKANQVQNTYSPIFFNEGAHEIGMVVTKMDSGQPLDGVVLGYHGGQCWVRNINGEYETIDSDDEVTRRLKNVQLQPRGSLETEEVTEEESWNSDSDSDSDSDSEPSLETEEEKTEEETPNYSINHIMNFREENRRRIPLQYLARADRKWNNCSEVKKILFMTGLITETAGLPLGAPSDFCKTRARMNQPPKESVLFNYLALILSVPHANRVQFLRELDQHENNKAKKRSTESQQRKAIRDGLAKLRLILPEIDIDYNEESKTYVFAELEAGQDLEYPEALFELKTTPEGTPLDITPQVIHQTTKYYINLTAPHGSNALLKVEEACMDSYVKPKFAQKCKLLCEDKPKVYKKEMFFISSPATSNRAMKYKFILYNTPNKIGFDMLTYLYDNPGKWSTDYIKQQFAPGDGGSVSSHNQCKYVSLLRHFLCDDTREVNSDGSRNYLRLTQDLYPEGIPQGWDIVHGEEDSDDETSQHDSEEAGDYESE